MEKKNRILIIMTGGTICSVKGEDGKSRSKASVTQSYLVDDYRESTSPFARTAEFDYRRLTPDVLSESMNVPILSELLDIFRQEEELEARYAGVILLHGTDTLAYTAAFLSFALAGLTLPVLLVSSNLPLRTQEGAKEAQANGYANFRAATELILNGILPNVYAVYRNRSGALLLHFGAHLLQCPNGTEDFHSRTETAIPTPENACLAGCAFESAPLHFRAPLAPCADVLLLSPHTSLDYRRLLLAGAGAVIHGTYHSESVSVGRPLPAYEGEDLYTLSMLREEDRHYSILYLAEECKALGIPLFLAPCEEESYRYGTTKNALASGAVPLGRITLEGAYMKALLGRMLGKSGASLVLFMQKSINDEAR